MAETAFLEMRPLKALLASGSQNSIFQKTPILTSEASKDVKVFISKKAVLDPSALFEMRVLTALLACECKNGFF